MKVFGWAADYNGCGYYRIGLPMWGLNQCVGVKTVASPTMHDSVKRGADVIFGQRVCLNKVTTTWQQVCEMRNNTVFEIDDDLFSIPPINELAYDFYQNPTIRANLIKNIKSARAVSVTNEHLANIMREYNPNVYILPNCVDAELLTRERKVNPSLTVGWAGSATHLGDFLEAAPQLRRFFNRNPTVAMHFIGTDYSHIIKKQADVTPWTQEVSDFYDTYDFDIGIAPLANDYFNRSKSYLKALEYSALGIPVIASDVLPYREFIQHGKTGFLVRHQHEWYKYLQLLADNPGLRKEIGEAGKERASEFTIQKNIVKWYSLCDEISQEAA